MHSWIGSVVDKSGGEHLGFIEEVDGVYILTFAWKKGNVFSSSGVKGAVCARSHTVLQDFFKQKFSDLGPIKWVVPQCKVIGFKSRWKNF